MNAGWKGICGGGAPLLDWTLRASDWIALARGCVQTHADEQWHGARVMSASVCSVLGCVLCLDAGLRTVADIEGLQIRQKFFRLDADQGLITWESEKAGISESLFSVVSALSFRSVSSMALTNGCVQLTSRISKSFALARLLGIIVSSSRLLKSGKSGG